MTGPARVIAHREHGTTRYVAVCKDHKKWWVFAGAVKQMTHNAAHQEAARHNRTEHLKEK